MLANTIALVTLAVMFGSEAKRANPPWNYGLWTLATIILLVGLGIEPITDRIPKTGELLTSVFSSPVAWFVLAIGLYLAIRPFWSGKKAAVVTRADKIRVLSRKADHIVQNIRYYRGKTWLYRDRNDSDDIIDAAKAGVSLLILFENQGLAVPRFTTQEATKVCIGLHSYFSDLIPIIRDGHFDIIDELAVNAKKRAEAEEIGFDNQNWYLNR
ncbi:hypothetical protein [Parasphingorhabdus flavimaris]|uniref:hypothetical protein n=1 Tax=Parasphingorhabdus flavimaris TaxID=266812 RepID=UPI0030021186